MNIEFIIENASKIILIVAAICTLISVITEFTKDRLPGQDPDKVPGSYSVPCNLRDRLLCLPVLRVNRVRVVLPCSRHFRGVHRGDRVL